MSPMEAKQRQPALVRLMKVRASLPPIPKTKAVFNRDGKTVRYRFAPLDKICDVVIPELTEAELLLSWDTEPAEDGLTSVCRIVDPFTGGTVAKSSYYVPRATGYGTNVSQDQGSANSVGRRYSLCNLMAIVPDDDDDGATASTPNKEFLVRHNEVVRECFDSIFEVKRKLSEGNIDGAAEAFSELTMKEFRTLWVAPTNGGIWTTEERNTIKNDAGFKARVHEYRTAAGWYEQEENKL